MLQEIDAGGTALRAAMEEASERVRGEVITAIGVLGSDFSELGFLVKDVTQAAAELQKSLDVQGANVRAIIEQNERQSTEIRLVREDLAVIAGRAAAGAPVGAGRGDGRARWVRGCPYRGLVPFGESDADVFYGRERLAAELAVKLATRVTHGGLVVVTGASGAGKSSLLRAGLLPILARGQQVQGSDQWPRIVMTPTENPLNELAAHLAALGGSDTISVRDRLTQHPDQGHLIVWSAVLAATARHGEPPPVSAGNAARLVLIVDQFEQVFTLNPRPDGEAARQAFVTALCTAATNPVGAGQEPPALVVVAVRGDYLLGNILDTHLVELVAAPEQRAFGEAKRSTLPQYCLDCDVRFACNGECPKNRFTLTPDGEPGLNYLCSGYKSFFTHIDGPMRIMANLLRQGRYADEITTVFAQAERGGFKW